MQEDHSVGNIPYRDQIDIPTKKMFTNSLLSWTRMLRKNPGVRPPTFPTPVITRTEPTVSIQTQVGISTKSACARDLFAHQQLGMYNESFTARVNPSGVAMVRLTPICEKKKKSLKKKRGKGKESHKRSCCMISCWYNLLSRISWFEFPDSFIFIIATNKVLWKNPFEMFSYLTSLFSGL